MSTTEDLAALQHPEDETMSEPPAADDAPPDADSEEDDEEEDDEVAEEAEEAEEDEEDDDEDDDEEEAAAEAASGDSSAPSEKAPSEKGEAEAEVMDVPESDKLAEVDVPEADKAVELTEEQWAKIAPNWPAHWPKPLLSEFCALLEAYKRADKHKNALPKDGYELAKHCLTGITPADDAEAELLYTLLLGKKNDEGKLDNAGQKDSLRAAYKKQFAGKGPKRQVDSGSFKLFADESYLAVEAAGITALTAHVVNLDDQSKGMDRGHFPEGILRQARSELKRVAASHAKRAASVAKRKAAAEAARKEKEAKEAPKRKRVRASRAKAEKDEEDPAAKQAKIDSEVEKRMEEMKSSMMARIKELQEGGLELGAAFAAYSAERAAAASQ